MAQKKIRTDGSTDVEPQPKRSRGEESAPTIGSRDDLHKKFGWTFLAVSLLFGTTLEALLAFKSAPYLLDPIRRELWSLAHFHGATLSLANLVYIRFASEPRMSENLRRSASNALVIGSLCMPAGFFLGGLSHPEGDPGFGILLSPFGAMLIVFTVCAHALSAWRK